ncbi:hypothetical protein EYZ11_009381 [Aspergillus tanneri]|uniref:Uncharacterized protein n=1 Tax=Aspergillus tanneri TaxID=1220188 RepID=A0A4S3J884_9EURO|nr:hypothetical protein EYZ11_009381 [Aspergillus tanneri]
MQSRFSGGQVSTLEVTIDMAHNADSGYALFAAHLQGTEVGRKAFILARE